MRLKLCQSELSHFKTFLARLQEVHRHPTGDVQFGEAGNGDTVSQRCRARELVEQSKKSMKKKEQKFLFGVIFIYFFLYSSSAK